MHLWSLTGRALSILLLGSRGAIRSLNTTGTVQPFVCAVAAAAQSGVFCVSSARDINPPQLRLRLRV